MKNYCSDNISELAKALIDVQREMAPATKDANNPFTKSKYATLNSVMESCRDALLQHGIWLTQLPMPAPIELGAGHIGLLTKLTHAESGQWQASLTVVPLPKSDPQGMGSAITYARRYALTAMLGMITEDDDGESAKAVPPEHQKSTATNNHQTRSAATSKTLPKSDLNDTSRLPELAGITYSYANTSDNQRCIIATGDTMQNKAILKDAGFRWDAQRRWWWKYADAI